MRSTSERAHNGGVEYRTLGSTGLAVSAVSFGAGPVSQLLVGDRLDAQRETILRALDSGVNWFDTAATYGNGQSEANLGRVLAELVEVARRHAETAAEADGIGIHESASPADRGFVGRRTHVRRRNKPDEDCRNSRDNESCIQ
ncbi:MAG: aldo/keto reductase [Planctomycetia bacterium]|nr:aldo/keto reductase [Planctomycetia bacterium]